MTPKTDSKSKILIVDYGTGNLNSVKRTLDRMGANSFLGSSAADVSRADKIILPGVGHFGKAMSNLADHELLDVLNEEVLTKRKPILGICLGMELLAKHGDEGNAAGLGWLDADAVRFAISDRAKYKVPHMGWNRTHKKKESVLLSGIDEAAEFYFAHSYHLRLRDSDDLLSETEYETGFPSAVERGNIFGVQYHPEKSHDAGALLLRNFVEL